MNVRNIPLFAGLCTAALFSGAAQAATDTTTFQVKIVITESCDVHTVSATDIDFGTQSRATASSSSPIDREGALQMKCTEGTAYQIAMNAGANPSSETVSAENRRMTKTAVTH